MEIAFITPIIAAIVSIVALCVTNIVSIVENKKGRHITIVTNQTIEHKERVFQNVAKILTLTHPLLIDDLRENDLLRLKKQLLIACSEFEIRIRPTSNETFEQITVMRSLVKIFLKCLKEQKNNIADMKKLYEAHTKFRELMSCFDSASWYYIKLQSDGKEREAGTFTQLYASQKCEFDKLANRPIEWIDDNF